jgi:phosphate transport system substrate-binding protein
LKKIAMLLSVAAIAGALVLASCATSTPNTPTNPTPSTPTTPTTPTSPTEPAAPSELSGTITEAGSTTVQPLAEKFANAFMEMYPKVTVTIQGGGSSVGVTSADEGTVDIGAASREIKPDEPPLVKHILCRDGIAIITDPASTVSGLTKDQVRQIFAGEIPNWSQVGGPNKDIIVVAREEGSGTRAAFEELVMGESLITNMAILQPSNGALRTTVATTPNSIGFLSFGYLDASVKALAIDGVEGTVENAKSGSYPIIRPLYFLTKEEPTGIVKVFISFCTSSVGQAIAVGEGYISVE